MRGFMKKLLLITVLLVSSVHLYGAQTMACSSLPHHVVKWQKQYDRLPHIQSYIKRSLLHITDKEWAKYTKLVQKKAHLSPEQETYCTQIDERSFCGDVADYVIQLFTQQASIAQRMYKVMGNFLDDNPIDLEHDEYLGSLDQFKNAHNCPVATSLFSSSQTPEHLLFLVGYIKHQHNHVYILEKMSTSTQTWWRIYTAWAGMFSLSDWLGCNPWPRFGTPSRCLNADESDIRLFTQFNRLHSLYGNGAKIFSAAGITHFMEGITVNAPNTLYVRKISVDPMYIHDSLHNASEKKQLAAYIANNIAFHI
jgi:hypothetical protein